MGRQKGSTNGPKEPPTELVLPVEDKLTLLAEILLETILDEEKQKASRELCKMD